MMHQNNNIISRDWSAQELKNARYWLGFLLRNGSLFTAVFRRLMWRNGRRNSKNTNRFHNISKSILA